MKFYVGRAYPKKEVIQLWEMIAEMASYCLTPLRLQQQHPVKNSMN